MPNKTLSQFTEQTEADINDFAVGYGPDSTGTLTEKRYSLPTLGSQILPYNGLSTGSFQIKFLADTVLDFYGATAVTTQEEVISWGSNQYVGGSTSANTLYLRNRWGGWYSTTSPTGQANSNTVGTVTQTPAKPAIIPFYGGTPRIPQIPINLKELNKQIIKVIDSRSTTIALLNDGTVWVKGYASDTTMIYATAAAGAVTWGDSPLGFGLGNPSNAEGAGTAKWLTGFFQIPTTSFKKAENDAPVNIVDVGILPENSPFHYRNAFWAKDEFGNVHIWGSFGSSAYGGSNLDFSKYEPINLSVTNSQFLTKVKDVIVVGGTRHAAWASDTAPAARQHTIFVLLNDGSLWARGYNGTGIAGTGAKTNLSTFTRCKKLDDSGNVVDVNDADILLNSTYSYNTFGYISKVTGTGNSAVNSIFVSGQAGTENTATPNFPRPAHGAQHGANVYFSKMLGRPNSLAGDPFVEGHLSGASQWSSAAPLSSVGTTLIVRTQKGRIYSAGDNAYGEGGRLNNNLQGLGPVLGEVGYVVATQGLVGGVVGAQASLFGATGTTPTRFKAVKIIVDRTSIESSVAIIAEDTQSTATPKKKYVFTAGTRPFSDVGGQAGPPYTSTFRALPFRDSVEDVILLGNGTSHTATLIQGTNLRTYGIGYSGGGLISETNGWVLLPQLIF